MAAKVERAPRKSIASQLPLEAVVREFLSEVHETLSPATERAYRQPLDLFLRYLRGASGHDPLLEDFTDEAARGWLHALRTEGKRVNQGRKVLEQPLAVASVRNYLRHVRAFANWLPKPPHRYVAESPLRYFKMPRGEETPKLPLSEDELSLLLKRAGKEAEPVLAARGRAMLLTLLDGGLRAQEIANLTLADVSLKDELLLVRRAKGKRPRMVAVSEESRHALKRYALLRDYGQKKAPAPTSPFFLTYQRQAFTYGGLRSWLTRLQRDTDIEHVHLHRLRHTSASDTLSAGADIRTVQLKLGHADIHTTQGYLTFTPEHIIQQQRAFSPVGKLKLDED
jgi:site-specific recombinase XerD